LCRATIDMYKDEQRLSDLELNQFEQSIIKIQSDLNSSEENAQQKANEYLSQLKELLKS
jgi:ribulose 1,5-bisphosphate carboxylase large subunit-like protein